MFGNAGTLFGSQRFWLACAAGVCSTAPSNGVARNLAVTSAPATDWSWLLIVAIVLPFILLLVYALWDPPAGKRPLDTSPHSTNNGTTFMRHGDSDSDDAVRRGR